jgi:[DsrC]-trisulfide reductase subunit J
MYDSGKIITGLIIFVALFTSPTWYDLQSDKVSIKPNPVLPDKKDSVECVNSAEYMRSYHMDILNDWRDEVVRKGVRTYVSSSGKKITMSLTKTCTNCHSNKTEFCDQCHNYLGVTPYCWNCHIEPSIPETK